MAGVMEPHDEEEVNAEVDSRYPKMDEVKAQKYVFSHGQTIVGTRILYTSSTCGKG